MRLKSTSRFRDKIWQRADRFLPGLVLVLGLFLVGARPVRAYGLGLVSPAQPVLSGVEVRLIFAYAAAAQNAAQETAPDVEPLLRQNLPQDPLRVAIRNAIQKGKQEATTNPAPMQNAAGNASQNTSLNATQNSTPNRAQNGSPNANLSSSGPPDVKRAQNPSQPAAAPTGSIPPRIQDGITAMLSAKANLEKAGSKWGGHKDTAIKLIDQALDACGQTETSDRGEVKSTPADETPSMQAGLTQLTAAQNDFQNAKNPWEGRRDKALALINQALSEVQAGLDYAKSHNTK